MNILTISSLYPNPEQARHGIFVETRLRHFLARYPDHAITVIAPVPYFPSTSQRFGDYGMYARVPRLDERGGIQVHHPRYLMLPKLGVYTQPYAYYLALKRQVRRLMQAGERFDVIDAHYYYPDGIAATMLGRDLGLPVVVTARGSDINVLSEMRWPRRLIKRCLEEASARVAVCQALADRMAALMARGAYVEVLRNGIDLEIFFPASRQDREQARRELSMEGSFALLCVGHLTELKGQHLAIEALSSVPDARLYLVGDGPEEQALRQLAEAAGVTDRVAFLGPKSQTQLQTLYGAADALLLASSREGWANVLLESMACGTPVVATRVGGTPEVVASPEAGVLIDQRTPDGIAEGIKRLRSNYPERHVTRRYAEQFSWDETSDGLNRIFLRVAGG